MKESHDIPEHDFLCAGHSRAIDGGRDHPELVCRSRVLKRPFRISRIKHLPRQITDNLAKSTTQPQQKTISSPGILAVLFGF